MAHSLVLVDGHMSTGAEARISALDPAVLLGVSVFETLPVIEKKPLNLDRHLLRLSRSASQIGLELPDLDLIQREVHQLIARFGPTARLRITLTGGGHRILWAQALDLSRFGRPVRVQTRRFSESPLSQAKHGSRAPWYFAVKESGVDELIWVSQSGELMEGTSSAIIGVREGGLYCAPNNASVLPSISRACILDQAHERGLRITRRGPRLASVWDGLYLCSSLRGLAPIYQIDGLSRAVWEPIGRALSKELWPWSS